MEDIKVALIEAKDITREVKLPIGVLVDGKMVGILIDPGDEEPEIEPEDLPF